MKSSISEQSNLNPSLRPQSEKIASDFWKAIRTNIKSQHQAPPIKPVSRGGNLTLTFAQERLWFVEQLQSDSSIHNMRAAFCLKGSLNVAALEQSLAEIVRRHEILRTTFAAIDGKPIQVISPYIDLKLPVIDVREVPEPEREIQVQQITRQEFEPPFDLAKVPLWRFKLLRLAEEEYLLLRTVHHIIFDGWSYSVFMRELAVIYEAFSTEKPSPLKELPIQYADFAQSQRQWLQGEVLESQLNYWKQQLSGSISPLELPIDHTRPSRPTYRGARQILVLPKDLTEKLKALSAQEGVSLFVTLLAAFKTLLYCYTEQDDMIICSPIAGRNRVETKKLIGYFNNILPMRTYLGENPSFRELMSRVSQVTLGAYEHQDLPFQKLMNCSNIPSTPLYRGMLALQNTPSQPLKLGEINISYLDVDLDTSNFDLFLSLTEDEENITGVLTFKTDLFNSSTITQMLENFQTLLESLVANPDQHLSDLPSLRDPESHHSDNSSGSLDKTKQEPEETFVAPRDELELQLTQIWEKVLGIKAIGIHDNFFDLGGHSLLAVKLFAEINKAFDKNLSVVTLFQAPTIEQVARFLSQEKSAESWRSLVPLQPKGYKPPLFLIHPCNGEIFIYRLLAQHLGLERPVYGLQAIGLNGKQTPDNRVEKMASHYIKEIQTVQPNGPYLLGGKQIGACVVFEMAQQLVSQGQQVKIVVLFDTRLSPHSFSERASRLLGNYLSLGPSYILKAVKGKIRAQMTMRIKSPILRLKAVIHKFFLSSETQTSENLSQNIQSIDIRDSLGQAFRNYAPKVYPGRGVLFQPIETNQGEVQGVDKENKMGWGKLFAGGLETHYLPDGNSNTIYTEPYVRILAEKISVCLEEVDQLIPEKRQEPESSILVPIQPNGSKTDKQAQKTEIISSEKWLEPGSSLVPIQPKGSKPPLFCIHPASIALYYRNLVQYLDSEQPFYVLQLDVGHKKQMPYSQSIEDLAAHYIREMRTVQPNGPYFLSGNCWGGLVAFEVAQQLHSQGEQVALLLLFDSYAPGAIKRLPFRERLSEYLDNLLQLRLDYLLTKVMGKAKQVKNSLQKKGQKTVFKLYQLIGYPLPSSLRDLPRLDVIKPATKNYTPKVYPGKVTVFHVQKLSPQGWSVDSQLGWGDLASQGVELHQIPGTHDSMFQEPHVKVLAKKLKIYLDVESQA